VGILVHDIVEARRNFGAALGISFGPLEPRVLTYTNDETAEITLCYSVEGPPFYELIQATGHGLFGVEHPEGVHHLGVWVPDAPEHCAALRAGGVGVDRQLASVNGPHGASANFVWFNAPDDLHGVRFEFVDDHVRPLLEARFRSGGAT
jgi:hypothetical protein